MMKIKKIIDISREISPETVLWPKDAGVKINTEASLEKGDSCNLSSIEMGLHTGTHIDAPFHFIQKGIGIMSLDLSKFIGFVKVFELQVESVITEESIRLLDIQEGDAVFFKTSNSELPVKGEFNKAFIGIDASAAQYLVDKKIRTVGVDYLSVDRFGSQTHPAHHILLAQEIGIIEGLYLKNVDPGTYFFSCLPLKIQGVEGTPARAVLLEIED